MAAILLPKRPVQSHFLPAHTTHSSHYENTEPPTKSSVYNTAFFLFNSSYRYEVFDFTDVRQITDPIREGNHVQRTKVCTTHFLKLPQAKNLSLPTKETRKQQMRSVFGNWGCLVWRKGGHTTLYKHLEGDWNEEGVVSIQQTLCRMWPQVVPSEI